MQLKSLHIKNFRLFEQSHICFSEGINHFIGANASGKTSILEALYFLSTGRSFRTNHLQELIQEGKSYFALELHFARYDIDHVLQVIVENSQIRILLNETKIPSLHGLLGLIQGVVITVDDVQIIKNGPQERREMLDLFLFSLDPLYHHHFLRYKKALKHRNALLKMHSVPSLNAFEMQLAKSGSYLIEKRYAICQQLEKIASPILSELSDGLDQLGVSYQCQLDSSLTLDQLQAALVEKYKESREKDQELFVTTVGPHRDDVQLDINQRSARLFASEGQQRTLCNALKMAQYQFFSQWNEEDAFLCIDDLKMSLDPLRQSHLLDKLKQYNQVFLTSPDPIEDLNQSGALFLCQNKAIQAISSKQNVS